MDTHISLCYNTTLRNNRCVLATRNPGKAREFGELLGGAFDILTLDDVRFTGDIDEYGSTFAENALIKAWTVHTATGLAVIADDSGLAVDALGGAPGVYSARFAGKADKTYQNENDAANNRLLLEKLKDVPAPRTARFVCAIAYVTDALECVVEGACEGEIGFAPSGRGGFGYDPLFYYKGISFADMSQADKNAVSHRSAAIKKLIEKLNEYGYMEA
ncbi:hypothetical protein FACS18948_0670 [Clostridia bacterium]|nr:hypothetical protein FACS18948_0670 [Clostridia bacterium]